MARYESSGVQRLTAGVAAAAALLLLLASMFDAARAMLSYLVAYVAALGVALGVLTLVMLGQLTHATWLEPLRRRAEIATAILPMFAVLFLPLVFGASLLYPWAAPDAVLSEQVRGSLAAKRQYLNPLFAALRALLYFAVWITLAHLLRRWSPPTHAADPQLAARRRVLSAVGLPLLLLTTTFAAIDWIMSLAPDWSSPVFGLYYLSAALVAGAALLALLAWRGDSLGASRDAVLSSLGKVLLTFVLTWGYIGYSQYLVIWIANVPGEVVWYIPRSSRWGWLSLLLLALKLAVPFVLLLPRSFKRNPVILGSVGTGLLVMHYCDMYWLIVPTLFPLGTTVSWLDGVSLVAFVAIFWSGAHWLWRRDAVQASSVGRGQRESLSAST